MMPLFSVPGFKAILPAKQAVRQSKYSILVSNQAWEVRAVMGHSGRQNQSHFGFF